MPVDEVATARREINVRPCLPAASAALALVAAATFLEGLAEMLPGAAIVAHCARVHTEPAYAGYLASPSARLWIAETASTAAPVGYALLSPPDLALPDLAPTDLELKRIYLFSRYAGRGAGQQLMDAAIAEARSQRALRLLLGVNIRNDRALAFYRKYQFH